ncbi:MAG: putative nucleoside-diphosphate sugar epimerase [Clostridia bacterium]|jgi:FlaA1/EpsC-like NDP-sugar epimerase|nr:putative nucleoside-diphosphate sugar epimerase [Clostridia bacterium]
MGFVRIQKNVFALTFVDAVLVNISMVLACFLKYDGLHRNIPQGILVNAVLIVIISTLVKVTLFYCFKLYSSIWAFASIHEMISIIGAAFVGNAIVMVFFKLYSIRVQDSIFIVFFLTDIFLIGGIRFAYRSLKRIINRYIFSTMDSKRILIIGDGEPGAIVVKELKEHPELRSIPVAILDDDKGKLGKKINGVPIVGQLRDILSVVQKKGIDEIIIALPIYSNKIIDEIYHTCLRTNCKVKILPSFTQLIDGFYVISKIRNVNIEDLLGREPVNLNINEISAYLEDKVVLVTGGGGSIGSELCRQIILFKPKQLIILDNYENNIYEIENELRFICNKLSIISVIANIREKDRIEEIIEQYRPDVVFHAAAHKHVPLMEGNPGEAIKNNLFGTLNLAESSDKFGVKRFVLISTDKAVNPTSIMGATKRVAEMIIQTLNECSKTEFVAVRFGNVLGSNGSVIPLFKKQIERGGPVTITHPDVTRFFMTIPEAAQLVIQAGAMAKGGEIFVLDMGKPVKIYDLAKKLIELSGFEPNVDIKIQFTGLRAGEKMYEELLLQEEGLRTTQNNKIFITDPVISDFDLLRGKIEAIVKLDINCREKVMNYLVNIISLANGNENNKN